jgi:Cellulase (glycosyl hydrolase family 5)
VTIATALAAVTFAAFATAASGATLTVSSQTLQVDGRPVFVVGVSLFDALGPTAPRDQDLDALKTWGVNLVRVWAHWHEPIYRPDGTLSDQGRTRLLQLAKRLESRGMIFELVLLRPGQLPGQPFAVFTSEADRVNAVEAMTVALRDFRNVLFDLYNEHDHPDGPISHQAARVLRDKVKAVDPARLVTISSTEHHLVSTTGEVAEAGAVNLRGEAGAGAGEVAVDLVAAHFPRTNDWAAATGGRIRALRVGLDKMGRPLPIYLNEERRADGRTPLGADHYARAIAEARSAGAAGWLFHTAAGFELAKKPFLDALSPDEREGLQRLKTP